MHRTCSLGTSDSWLTFQQLKQLLFAAEEAPLHGQQVLCLKRCMPSAGSAREALDR